MRIPHRDSRAYKVAKHLHSVGGASKNECIAAFPDMQPTHVREAINYMVSSDMVTERDGLFRVKPYLATHFYQCEPHEIADAPLVPPRTAPEFRPLSSKNMAHLAPRRESIREVSFLNGSIGFGYGYQL